MRTKTKETTANAEKAGTVRYNWAQGTVRNAETGRIVTIGGVQLSLAVYRYDDSCPLVRDRNRRPSAS